MTSLDFTIDLATAPRRTAQQWRNKKWTWDEFSRRCSQTLTTNETVAEYAAMPKEEQSRIKDVGGFVGGYLADGKRRGGSVRWRSMATLDIDYGRPDVWDDFQLAYSCAALMYSTHKHTAAKPRLRLVIPFSRNVTPEEYEPICRRIAESLGIDMFDETTYQLPRLFYWPSTSKDGEFFFAKQDGAPLDVDATLATYADYRDASSWPAGSREGEVVRREIRKAGEPTDKPGMIGAFCRAYTIEAAIETFLADVYEPTATDGRYTYKRGHVSGGLLTYDGKFAYSYHATDPASMTLCNAFDLVRIHLYGEEDEGRKGDPASLPSYKKMVAMAQSDPAVRALIARERLAEAGVDFAGMEEGTDLSWMQELDVDAKTGRYLPTADNIVSIIENDPGLKGHIWHDQFSGFDIVEGGLPWDESAKLWGNRDDANLRVYIERTYGIQGRDKIKDAKEAVLTARKRHPIREYLESLRWDGVRRLDRLVIDYVGAEDCELNRAMTRKQFVAAVARVMEPGCKHDYCLILAGPEGVGKSTLLGIMGGEWFNDSLTTTEGKEGMEHLRRSWIIELAELSSIKRSDAEQVKNYISRRDDIYRAAYGSVVEKHPRQCVFFGTTNEDFFLKGENGNRRFWVIRVNPSLRAKSAWQDELARDRDQLWAEAVQLYRAGEKRYLPDDLEREARERQKEYNDNADDPMRTMLESYLDTLLPTDWRRKTIQERRAFINNPDPLCAAGIVRREAFCVPEFICERLCRDMSDKEYKYLSRRVGKLMDEMAGWESISCTRHAEALYGRQKGYKRTSENDAEDDDL